MKRKRITVAVTVSFPSWMKPGDARREVRTLINNQTNYLECGPDYQDVDEKTIRCVSIRKGARP